MKKQRILYAVLAAMVIGTGLVGCGNETKPVAIDEKVDKCDVCNMLVKNNQFAVEVVQKNGKAMKFDDLGCLFKWTEKNGLEQVDTQFVRDYNTQEWVKLDDATYVFDKDVVTPMAYNVISFKAKSDAEAFLKKQGHGELLTYQELMQHIWEPNKEMMQKMMDMNKGMSGGNGMSGSDMKSGM
ncbi:nitrous oxide reductase accessory protein NosL [Tumebacillus flagellatus]|uniref:Lipoprotein n=1 Tax=Tumebacillus flagellatus TaxID=1157490 RepID=A0A074LU77_9BACL|nr:nitrous oxide reductase accessory protein NosL [Tumebacillus flagellatus]KEO84110.1 hypothetical protein EL26_06500 [Tumebacillus flagellatus]